MREDFGAVRFDVPSNGPVQDRSTSNRLILPVVFDRHRVFKCFRLASSDARTSPANSLVLEQAGSEAPPHDDAK